MTRLICAILGVSFLIGCQENETTKDNLTGNESTYALLAGSEYSINGTVTFKERTDGTTLILVSLTGTEGNIKHPVHLHLDTIAEAGAKCLCAT